MVPAVEPLDTEAVCLHGFNGPWSSSMSDHELAIRAISEAQSILEEYLEPKHHDNEKLLDRLVEVLERRSVIVAVDRLRRGVVR
jgi:hypothetical protein